MLEVGGEGGILFLEVQNVWGGHGDVLPRRLMETMVAIAVKTKSSGVTWRSYSDDSIAGLLLGDSWSDMEAGTCGV